MVQVTDSVAELGCEPRQPGRAHPLPASGRFLPSTRCFTQAPAGRCIVQGRARPSTLLVEGRGGWREEKGGGMEDFPKEASPGQRGEEGRDLGQERLGFR